MRSLIFCAAIATLAATASATTVVADYQGNFSATNPAPGWRYLWNPSGVPLFSNPLTFTGNSANYAPLSYNSGDLAYATQSTGALPLAPPGSYLSTAPTYVTLGQSDTQASDGIRHYVILAYTFSAAQVAADGPNLTFHTYNFNIPNDPTLGSVDVAVFKNDSLVFENAFAEGTSFSDATFQQDYSFGTVQGGDTLYIALGDTGSYAGQQIGVAYTLALAPEPSALSVLVAIPLLMRRRRCSGFNCPGIVRQTSR
jgi:hypothetical protein